METTAQIASRYGLTRRRIDYLAQIGVLKCSGLAPRRGMPRSFTYGSPAELVLANALLDNRLFKRVHRKDFRALAAQLGQAIAEGRTTLILWLDLLRTDKGIAYPKHYSCELVSPANIVDLFVGAKRLGMFVVHLDKRMGALAV